MTVRKRPCKGCEKREIGCHATCEEYKQDREQYKKWQSDYYKYYEARSLQAEGIRRVHKITHKGK